MCLNSCDRDVKATPQTLQLNGSAASPCMALRAFCLRFSRLVTPTEPSSAPSLPASAIEASDLMATAAAERDSPARADPAGAPACLPAGFALLPFLAPAACLQSSSLPWSSLQHLLACARLSTCLGSFPPALSATTLPFALGAAEVSGNRPATSLALLVDGGARTPPLCPSSSTSSSLAPAATPSPPADPPSCSSTPTWTCPWLPAPAAPGSDTGASPPHGAGSTGSSWGCFVTG
ncbi:hypothetical protein V8C86DRAFT_2524558 [Haematococcus lacustris]